VPESHPTETRSRGARPYHWLAALPTLVLLAGIPFVNRVHPMILGLPLLMAWIVFWVIATSATMGLILYLDGARERGER
jgi:hypothetical protein